MKPAEISKIIDRAAPELRAAGLAALYLFGSQARGDACADSDIDLAFDVTDEANEKFSVIDQARVQLRLQDILGCEVDFIERRAFGPFLRQRVENDMVRLM
jgi:uncharacterized protein